jgi:hypothetical protein
MAQPNPLPEKPGVSFQRPCPKCGLPMWLVRLLPVDTQHDERTFECQVCERSENMIVKFR